MAGKLKNFYMRFTRTSHFTYFLNRQHLVPKATQGFHNGQWEIFMGI